MISIVISLILFACTIAGVLLGMFLRQRLPAHHLRDESKDILKTATGLIATLVALVLGLLVASSKSTFDTMNAGLTQTGAKIITLHRILVRYGPEAKDIRDLQRRSLAASVERIWPVDGTKVADAAAVERATGAEDVHQGIQALVPKTDAQRSLQAQALQISGELLQARWLLIEQAQNTVPMAFLVILAFWLTVLYVSFGMLAPRNATALVALVVCALSTSGAIFLSMEMNRPIAGLVKVSSAPLQRALEVMSQ
jgi:hypothetical protein